ncbi:MAG: universal stress protein [Flavobacteriales bacterium]|nr:universal stress protein [Flavobacteriales bacterium]
MDTRTILLPTDFSESAHNAISFALRFYEGRPYHYILLNTVEPTTASSNAGMIVSMSEILTRDSLAGLKKELEWVQSLPFVGIATFETMQMFGDVVNCTEQLVADRKIDMVIMGTTGASGLKEFFVGSNAAAVIQDIPVPVLTVPFNARYQGMRKIIYATDYKSLKSPHILDFLKKMVQVRQAELLVFNVVKPSSSVSREEKLLEKERLADYFSDVSVSFHEVANNDTVEGISDFVSNTDGVHLICMIPRKKSFFEKIFSKSIARKVAYHSHVPMLTMQDH